MMPSSIANVPATIELQKRRIEKLCVKKETDVGEELLSECFMGGMKHLLREFR
jgi:hypothetical protein